VPCSLKPPGGYFYHTRLGRNYYLQIVNTTDLSSTQKLAGSLVVDVVKGGMKCASRGGAMKVAKRACHLCGVLSSECHLPRVDELRCKRCKDAELERCYCAEMNTRLAVEKWTEELRLLLLKLPTGRVPALVYLQMSGISALTPEQLEELEVPAGSKAEQGGYLSTYLVENVVSARDDDEGTPRHINYPCSTLSARSLHKRRLKTVLEMFGGSSGGAYDDLKIRARELLDTAYLAVDLTDKLEYATIDPTQLIYLVEMMVRWFVDQQGILNFFNGRFRGRESAHRAGPRRETAKQPCLLKEAPFTLSL
jgi:hypothetical protein